MNSRDPLWGLLHRHECLVPTRRGLILFTLLGVVLMVIVVLQIHPFLAITEPESAEVLVIEGWLPDYALDEARVEFERGHYRRVYVTGGPLEIGAHLSEYKTYAELGAETLVRIGMSKSALIAVPAPSVRQDRTYASAVALKNWLHQQGSRETGINLVSLGAHARRSRLLFQKALGEESRVGIIAIEDREYDPKRWWKFSQGVRTVVDEFIAYIYASVVFPVVGTPIPG